MGKILKHKTKGETQGAPGRSQHEVWPLHQNPPIVKNKSLFHLRRGKLNFKG